MSWFLTGLRIILPIQLLFYEKLVNERDNAQLLRAQAYSIQIFRGGWEKRRVKRRWMRVTGVAHKYSATVTSRQSLESWHERGNILGQNKSRDLLPCSASHCTRDLLQRSFACIRRHSGTNRGQLRGNDMGLFQVHIGLAEMPI